MNNINNIDSELILNEYLNIIEEFNNKISELENKYPKVISDLMWNYDPEQNGKRRISINKISFEIFHKKPVISNDMKKEMSLWNQKLVQKN